MPGDKLTYFNARGRAEIIRYIYAQAGVDYEDIRLEKEQWAAIKATSGAPFGQLPMLETDGIKLAQSNTIARYLARKYKLAGKTDLDQAKVDMFVDCFEDSTKPMMGIFFETDEAKKTELKKKFKDETLPGHLTLLENLLKQNHGGDGFLVGTELTWADLSFINFIGWTVMAAGEDPLTKFPKLKALQTRVESSPKIKAWIEKRPKTER